MSTDILERRRTGWDLVVGALLVIGGLVVLGNAVLATAVSVLLIGWTALIGGVVLAVGAFLRSGSGVSWSAALGGAVLAVLGLLLIRNPVAGAATLTLLAAALFLTTGLTRVLAASWFPEARVVLAISGVVSLVLGLIILFNLVASTFLLLGVLMGVQLLVEGVTLAVAGRVRRSAAAAA